ncbi:hypothetical protein CEQ06_06325 [Corynebacterium jeikeium]|nr:hypothetical protein CEQ06_06325 [Corynebacterium jeikeium]
MSKKQNLEPVEDVELNDVEQQEQAKIDKFNELRKRARKLGFGNKKPQATEFVLGEEYGFDPEIVVPMPKLRQQEALQRAMNQNDAFAMARALYGFQYDRIISEFDQYPDGEELFAMVILDTIEGLYGKGATSGLLQGGFRTS